jgi:cell division septation protein DedD
MDNTKDDGTVDQQVTKDTDEENKTESESLTIEESVEPSEASTSAESEQTQDEEVRAEQSQDVSSTTTVVSSNHNTLQTTPVNVADIRFSIQVGIYGTLKNAQKMKRKLLAQNLDAYVSAYTKNGKVRFNVRMGYFADRKSANLALKNYKQNQKGDGYLVNFSEKNIIHSDEDDYELAIMESDSYAASKTATDNTAGPDIPAAEKTGDQLTTQDSLTEGQDSGPVY